jgi:flagellar hook-length control protein FliK
VAPFAVALALGPDASLSIALDPPELGRVEVSIERSGEAAHVSLRAERPETLALLQRDRAELERALAAAGFGDAAGDGAPSLSFGLGGQGAQQGEARERSQQGGAQSGAPRPGLAGDRGPAGPAPLPPSAARVAPRGLLDLAV